MRAVLVGLALLPSWGCLLEFDDKLLDGGGGPDSGTPDAGPAAVLSCDCTPASCQQPCGFDREVGPACECGVGCVAGRTCNVECVDGSICDLACSSDCSVDCVGGDCSVDCAGGNCTLTASLGATATGSCHGGASCTFECASGASCEDIQCTGSDCILDCAADATCSFRNCAGGSQNCPGGEVVCRADCP